MIFIWRQTDSLKSTWKVPCLIRKMSGFQILAWCESALKWGALKKRNTNIFHGKVVATRPPSNGQDEGPPKSGGARTQPHNAGEAKVIGMEVSFFWTAHQAGLIWTLEREEGDSNLHRDWQIHWGTVSLVIPKQLILFFCFFLSYLNSLSYSFPP